MFTHLFAQYILKRQSFSTVHSNLQEIQESVDVSTLVVSGRLSDMQTYKPLWALEWHLEFFKVNFLQTQKPPEFHFKIIQVMF